MDTKHAKEKEKEKKITHPPLPKLAAGTTVFA